MSATAGEGPPVVVPRNNEAPVAVPAADGDGGAVLKRHRPEVTATSPHMTSSTGATFGITIPTAVLRLCLTYLAMDREHYCAVRGVCRAWQRVITDEDFLSEGRQPWDIHPDCYRIWERLYMLAWLRDTPSLCLHISPYAAIERTMPSGFVAPAFVNVPTHFGDGATLAPVPPPLLPALVTQADRHRQIPRTFDISLHDLVEHPTLCRSATCLVVRINYAGGPKGGDDVAAALARALFQRGSALKELRIHGRDATTAQVSDDTWSWALVGVMARLDRVHISTPEFIPGKSDPTQWAGAVEWSVIDDLEYQLVAIPGSPTKITVCVTDLALLDTSFPGSWRDRIDSFAFFSSPSEEQLSHVLTAFPALRGLSISCDDTGASVLEAVVPTLPKPPSLRLLQLHFPHMMCEEVPSSASLCQALPSLRTVCIRQFLGPIDFWGICNDTPLVDEHMDGLRGFVRDIAASVEHVTTIAVVVPYLRECDLVALAAPGGLTARHALLVDAVVMDAGARRAIRDGFVPCPTAIPLRRFEGHACQHDTDTAWLPTCLLELED